MLWEKQPLSKAVRDIEMGRTQSQPRTQIQKFKRTNGNFTKLEGGKKQEKNKNKKQEWIGAHSPEIKQQGAACP